MPTDDLRTRIAAVLNRFPADMRPVEIVNLEKADAVIRELQLTVLGDGIIVGIIVGESHG